MALDINGYNATFNEFVRFAQRNANVGDEKAVASARIQTEPLEGRKIVSVTNSLTDEVHKWMRTNDEYAVNDRTRALFKAAVVNMFGGESKIPATVKRAMLLGDFDAGKPLTARRILAVKAAIDADGTAKARSARIALETFSPEVKAAAVGMGFYKHELPKLARAAHFYMQATGLNEMDALHAVAEQGSKANRLMSYGGRFLQSAENFADGLRLLDLFAAWHEDLCTAARTIQESAGFLSQRDFSAADTPSKLNADTAATNPQARAATEKLVFEQIASDPAANLKETDGERLFGVANNDASRFVCQNFGASCFNTVAGIPPAKRAVVFKTFNLFCSLAGNAQEAKASPKNRLLLRGLRPMFLARVLRNLDGVLALEARGRLTAKNLVKLCFPDMVKARATGNWDFTAVRDFLEGIADKLDIIGGDPRYRPVSGPMQELMNQTGATLQEADDALFNNKPVPLAPYVSAGQQDIQAYGTIAGGRAALAQDLDRPANYSVENGPQDILPPDAGFTFTFPDGESLLTNGTHQDNIARVGDRVEAMCGARHPKQASSVMLMLSQGGLAPINRGLRPYGVHSSEHSAVDYTLTKNAETGAITIKYTSPEALPFRFEWTATVDTDGKVTATPLKFEKPVAMDVGLANRYVADAAKALGVKLTRPQKALAAALLAQHGAGMYEKNARILARFAVKLRLADASANGDAALVGNMAATIRNWRDFGFDERGMGQLNAALKTQANALLATDLAAPGNYSAQEPTIHASMAPDANRAVFTVNGKRIVSHNGDHGAPLIAAIKQALPGANAQKAVTAFLHQGSYSLVGFPQNHLPWGAGPGQAEPVDVHTLPGAGKLANRNMQSGLYEQLLNGSNDVRYDLQVSEDGTKATLTTSYLCKATMGAGAKPLDTFAPFTVQTRLTFDLSAEVPTIVDARFAQTLG